MIRRILLAACAAIGLSATAAQAQPATQNLRIGLREDPDILDPTLARTFVGRIVFAGLCDKLFDINSKLEIIPQLALGHETSADGKTVTLKLRDGVTKYLLKKALEPLLPADIIYRKKKGFGTPVGAWFRTGRLVPRPEGEFLAEKLAAHRAGQADERLYLWCQLCLGEWIERRVTA